MHIHSRRYTGCKYKLINWIRETILSNCENCDSFFDVFAGTGVVTAAMLDVYNRFIVNDFLYSNEIIYKAFFCSKNLNMEKINTISVEFNNLCIDKLAENYVSQNFGEKYFSHHDALIIGHIRETIQEMLVASAITDSEYAVLLASLLYSLDRSANTVGHYDAYIKGRRLQNKFHFSLIEPLNVKSKEISIYREDANKLVRRVQADVAFVDPPYNSRQYSRFYHVLENITTWQKPLLCGVAMKPEDENMSGYCRTSAPLLFEDLIKNLNVKYIAVTYNNTYNSKSSSSKNKIALEEIKSILSKKGETQEYSKEYQFFNAGKTDLSGHKEFLFLTKVGNGR